MRDLVTIEEAREHLRLDADSDGGPDDAWLRIFIPAISEAVALWLKHPWRLYETEIDSAGDVVLDSNGDPLLALDSNAEPIVRPSARGAVLVELESQYRFRGGESKDNVVPADAGHGYVLNKASTALLTPLRRPTLA
jgi:hypothetical protein